MYFIVIFYTQADKFSLGLVCKAGKHNQPRDWREVPAIKEKAAARQA
jgi:hypothetical protein